MIDKSFGWIFYSEEDRPQKVMDFLYEVDAVCKKYGFEISHEDFNGGFQIFDGNDNEWFLQAVYIAKEGKSNGNG